MADEIELKTATPDTSIDDNAFVVGADSQSAASPSMFQLSTILNYLFGRANTWTGVQTFDGAVNFTGGLTLDGVTLDGDDNTISDIGTSSLKTRTGADGAVVTGTAGTDGDLAAWNADGDVVDGPTPPTGAIVGTTDTQTLTNKTIDADNNTISNLAHGAEVDNATSGVHGVTGDVVGTTDTQTLTNKTIDADNNTISNLAHGAEVDNPSMGVHGVTGSVVGTTDTQTLTNKTIVGDDNTLQDIATTSLKTRTGSDASVVTGTAGTSGALVTWNVDGDAVDGPTPPAGDIVGTTDTQTLTNKTLTSPTVGGNTAFDTDTLYVDATNDRVGVGVGVPTAKLHVEDDAGTATAPALYVRQDQPVDGQWLALFSAGLAANKGNSVQISGFRPGLVLTDLSGSAGDFKLNVDGGVFAISVDTDDDEAMDSNGRFDDLTDALQLDSAGSTTLGGYGSGTLQTDASGNITASSDERLKTDIAAFHRGLADVQALAPITYKWNVRSGMDRLNSYAGFSAQNVRAAIPEAVSLGPDGYLTLAERPVVAALVNAVKELAARVEQLEGQA